MQDTDYSKYNALESLLPRRSRIILLLRAQRVPVPDIAAELGISEQRVYAHLRRARARILEALHR